LMPMEDACGQKRINRVVPSSDSHCRLTTKPKFSAPNNQAIALILAFASWVGVVWAIAGVST
jgi:hypothetical protein